MQERENDNEYSGIFLNHECQIFPKSGLGLKNGLFLQNLPHFSRLKDFQLKTVELILSSFKDCSVLLWDKKQKLK